MKTKECGDNIQNNESKGVQLRLLSTACGLSFCGGEMKTGTVQFYHKTGYKPHVAEKVFCKDCQEYKDRVDIANKINEIFKTEGSWDFSTCYKACVKHARGW